jgi:transcriptional regulator with XRE-family HTH domain
MEKRLDVARIREAMDRTGLNQAQIADKLGVSRAIVSSWLKGQKYPRPDKLLKLGLTLDLAFQDIVQKFHQTLAPIVAFRKKGNRKTTDLHLSHAQEIGLLLEQLVPYFPFNGLFLPPILKSPTLDYDYIQKTASSIRSDLGIKIESTIQFGQIIKKLTEYEVVLIPVLHGQREHHENALHIFLPSSKSTWIFLNLDSKIHDFKFWMAHELGHVLTPSLRDEDAEDFADAFAQALLFPQEQTLKAYSQLKLHNSKNTQIRHISNLANSLVISPITIYRAVNAYAEHKGLPPLKLDPDIYVAAAGMNKHQMSVNESLNNGKPFTASAFIAMTRKLFGSPFFDILKIYLSENEKGPGFIQAILETSLIDSKEIHAELVK